MAKRALFKIIRKHQSEGDINLKNIRFDYQKQKQKLQYNHLRSFSSNNISSDGLINENICKNQDTKSLKRIPEYIIKTRKQRKIL